MEPTLQNIKDLIKPTWFDAFDQDDSIHIESREYGDISEEIPGAQDIAEAKRIRAKLREHFPKEDYLINAECIDECVLIIFQKK